MPVAGVLSMVGPSMRGRLPREAPVETHQQLLTPGEGEPVRRESLRSETDVVRT